MVETAASDPKNRREGVPQPPKGGKRLPNRPQSAPFEGLAHLGLHPARSFSEAAARSTFQPATL